MKKCWTGSEAPGRHGAVVEPRNPRLELPAWFCRRVGLGLLVVLLVIRSWRRGRKLAGDLNLAPELEAMRARAQGGTMSPACATMASRC
jgi:hypothetical protein